MGYNLNKLKKKSKQQSSSSSSRSVYKVASALSSTKNKKKFPTTRRRHSTSDVSSIADSMASNLTVAESVISRATARKTRHHVIN